MLLHASCFQEVENQPDQLQIIHSFLPSAIFLLPHPGRAIGSSSCGLLLRSPDEAGGVNGNDFLAGKE